MKRIRIFLALVVALISVGCDREEPSQPLPTPPHEQHTDSVAPWGGGESFDYTAEPQ